MSSTPIVALPGAQFVKRLPSSAASNNATIVSATPGTLRHFVAFNSGVAIAYIKFFNKATVPVPATDTPFMTYILPAGGGFAYDGALQFNAGIGFALVTGAADGNDTGVAAAQILGVNVIYDTQN